MTQGQRLGQNGNPTFSFTARDLVAIAFRRQRVVVLCLAGVLLGAALASMLLPKYEAETKILVMKDRADPAVSAGQNGPVNAPNEAITEEELNSEIELLHSRDVLRNVVLTCGLDRKFQMRDLLNVFLGPRPQNERIEKAVRHLDSALDSMEVVKKSNVIDVTYDSHDPELAFRVLKTLDAAYLEKHSKVHRPNEQFQFFDEETERHKKILTDAETQLKGFANHDGETSPQVLRDIALQKLNDFNALLHQTQSDISENQNRIRQLEKEAGITPERLVTQDRTSDDALLLQQLKSTLLTLELKRTELLTKFQPDYPLVREVDDQIAKARGEVESAERRPVRDKTTDENPTYTWISGELAKAKADLAGQQARQTALQTIVRTYEARVRDLEQEGLRQHDLLRIAKTAEDNYLLYQQKREEARITDALDKTRILNVAVAEEPVVPALPARPAILYGLLGTLLGCTVTVVVVFVLEYLDQSFRTPVEVETVLNVPVLAAVPHNRNGFSRNGHSRANDDDHRNGNGDGKSQLSVVPNEAFEGH
jgi:uncharacterized protein involved in exopolysaccharide biosynthesis